jgi:hypothetical protein
MLHGMGIDTGVDLEQGPILQNPISAEKLFSHKF